MKTSFQVLCGVTALATLSVTHAANLVPNPDFDDGLAGWSMVGTTGVMTLDADAGFPTAPSLDLGTDTVTPTAGTRASSSCIPADDGTPYDFFINAYGGGAWGGVDAFSDADCSAPNGSVATELFRSSGGTLGLAGFLLPDGTHSARAFVASTPPPLGSGTDTHFDHILFGPSGTVLDGIDINQEGLTGTWYDVSESGQGMQFVIRPDDANPGTGSVFGAWYTYDVEPGGTDTQRWYSIQAEVSSDTTSAPVTIYQNTGGTFDAPPVTTAVAVGTGTLEFSSCVFGEFTYLLDDGRSGAIPLSRLLPNVDCVETGAPTNPPGDAGYSGSWYASSLGGQGFIIDVTPATTTGPFTQIFAGWYTYAANGTPTSGTAGQRWFSAQGPNTLAAGSSSLNLYESTGGTFDSSATTITTNPVGTAVLTFDSCISATFAYTFDSGDLEGTTGMIELTRLGDVPASCATTN
jgi:hypothetical protein